MSDLNFPNIKNKYSKNLFKKKLTLRRKSKRKLLTESFFMILLATLLSYFVYIVPQKSTIFSSFSNNVNELWIIFIQIFENLYQILLAIFIVLTVSLVLILIIGSSFRIIRIFKRKTKQISLK